MTVRTHSYAKIFFLVTFTGFVTYVLLAFFSLRAPTWKDDDSAAALQDIINGNQNRFTKDLKYILMWNFNKKLNNNKEGQEPFINANCKYFNCYVTCNRSLLSEDYSNFNAIVFHGFESNPKLRPKRRKPFQKYVFFSQLPSEEYTVCNVHADRFFNWTWSYKLYSDIFSPFIEVRDKRDDYYVAPSRLVDWIQNTDPKPFTKEQQEEFKSKRKAVAWYGDNCHTRNERMQAITDLSKRLGKHNMAVDIFGKCGRPCPKGTLAGCKELFKREYYFFLAYEASSSEDYVTREVLTAYDSLAVPIVRGMSDYKKFLPDSSYIDTKYLTTDEVAAMIVYAIRNPGVYHNYFRWREFYKIREYNTSQAACNFCALLNSDEASLYTTYDHFRSWWYSVGTLREKCLPYNFEKDYKVKAKEMGLMNKSVFGSTETEGTHTSSTLVDGRPIIRPM